MEDVELQRIYQLKTGICPLTSEYLDWKKKHQEQIYQIWEERYVFLSDWNLYLIAQYNLRHNRQSLILEAIDPNTGKLSYQDTIYCIHTAITDIPADVVENRKSDPDFLKELLNIRSSEGVHPLKLAPEEEFFALKSWVQGIAEAGFNAIAIQRDIEAYAHLMSPLSQFLFTAMLHIDINLVIDYINWIKKECTYEDRPHIPSIAANLLHITKMVFLNKLDPSIEWEQCREIITELMDLISHSLRYRLEDQKFFMEPIGRILKYILKQEKNKFGNLFVEWICDIYRVKKIAEVEQLKKFICPFLDKFTAHYWVLQKFYSRTKTYVEKSPSDAVNEIDVQSFVDELQDLGISSKEVYHFLKIYRKDGYIIKLSDIIKSKRRKFAVPASNISDLQIKIKVTEDFAKDSIKVIPSPTYFLKYRKYSFLYDHIINHVEDSEFYQNYCVKIRGMRYFCEKNFNDNEDDLALDLSNTHLNSLEEIEGIDNIAEFITHLDLSENPINNLERLNTFKKLSVLNLKDTRIQDLEQIRSILENLYHLHTILFDNRVLKPVANSLSRSDAQKIAQLLSKHHCELDQRDNDKGTSEEYLKKREMLFRAFSSCYVKSQDNSIYTEDFTIVTLIRKYLRQKRSYGRFWGEKGILTRDEKKIEILS